MASSGIEQGLSGLKRQFLAWVAARPRSYGETMDAWRTSCPRLSVWEDALGEGLVAIETGPRQATSMVVLTDQGRSMLAAEQPVHTLA